MYNELLSEADSNKALEDNVKLLKNRELEAVSAVKKKKVFLMKTQRRFDNLEHVSLIPNKTRKCLFYLKIWATTLHSSKN